MIDFDDLSHKISSILVILIFMNNLNFMQHEKSFYNLGLGGSNRQIIFIFSIQTPARRCDSV